MTTIHLGFEVGSGDSVEIPLLNLAVTGMTQSSGKTTTLEALVKRSGVRALTFVTKRGEGSFTDGRRIQPYFRNRADWQFVSGLLDATLQEKNKFLRSWIIKICRTTKTLADVQREVRKALETARGVNEGVYTQLDAYLDMIVPEIERADLAPTLDLRPGLNVMDVGSYPAPMQMLFVQSALDWINERERDTVVVIPEAWEMVPEGRNTPVKASAEALVRKGSAIGNRIWLDSQDMAGVSKVLLRGCSVWLIGVQREANEIKRNLSNIPASIKKPTAMAVATLERGQFYACWGSHAVKTYVQPAWMEGSDAQYVARGYAVDPARLKPPAKPKEKTVDEREAQELRAVNERLAAEVKKLTHLLEDERRRDLVSPLASREAEAPATRLAPTNGHQPPAGSAVDLDIDYIYSLVKERLASEAPGIIKLLTIRPELEVRVERKTLSLDGSSLKGRVAGVLAKGFMKETQRHADIKKELERTGASVNSGNMATALKDLVRDGFLTNEDGGYREVAGMKSRIVEA